MEVDLYNDNMKSTQNWYELADPTSLDSPALLFYPQRMKENIRLLIEMIDDVDRLRPHVKTHKTVEATRLMMEAGIKKFKCATIAEAEMLGICKVPDALLAYQPTQPKLKRLLQLIKIYKETKFSCLVDNEKSAEMISEVALSNEIVIPVFIDINVGMNRTGIQPEFGAIQLFEYCNQLKGIQLKGWHFYDGHIRETDIIKRAAHCNAVFAVVEGLNDQLIEKGFPKPQMVAGGSPSFSIYSKKEGVECSPGTFILWDKGYMDSIPEQKFYPAAVLLTRIVSLPDETKLCLDLGYKSVASENPIFQRVYFLNADNLQVISHSEEHLVVEAEKGHHWKIGDLLYALPIHVCPTCALYESAITIEDKAVTGSWKIIGRDRKISV